MKDKVVTVLDVLQEMKQQDIRVCTFESLLEIQKVRKGTKLTIGVAGDLVGSISSGQMSGMLFLFDFDSYKATLARLEGEVEK